MQPQPEVPTTPPGWLRARDVADDEHRGELALELVDGEDFEAVLRWLAQVRRLRIRFENFADGRGFSWARRLRQRYGYGGELIAVGDVLPDQVQFLEECGFDRVEPGRSPAAGRPALPRFTVAYPR